MCNQRPINISTDTVLTCPAKTLCRLKLVPRVINIDEWVQKGPLSQAEHRLLTSYNEKPILTRPQVRLASCFCDLSEESIDQCMQEECCSCSLVLLSLGSE